ncbi:MAG: hypothetical protein WC788_03820 [Candidatus Paceibacterota bacterium]
MKIMDRELIMQLVGGVLLGGFIGYMIDMPIPPTLGSIMAMFLGSTIGVAITRYWQKRKAKKVK